MANIKEIRLGEVKVHSKYLNDSISAILNTILFVRAPNVVKPKDTYCEQLIPMVYVKCGSEDIDQTVSTVLEIFKTSLYKSGQYLRGDMRLSFYEKRELKEYFGFITRSENIYFERWYISILLTDNIQNDPYRVSYDQVENTLRTIMETVTISSDHVPPNIYEYEIQVTPNEN